MRLATLLLLLSGCSSPDEYKLKLWMPDYMKTPSGSSRMWLACSPDGEHGWHRVARMDGPGTIKPAFDDPTCVVVRWEIER